MTMALVAGVNAELAQQWYSWLISIPSNENPAVDNTGQYTQKHMLQPNGIYFLTGGYNNPDSLDVRNITIKTGIPIFFPVLVQGSTYVPSTLQKILGFDTEARLKQAITIDKLTYLDVTLDGKELVPTRQTTPVFEATYNKDNIYRPQDNDFTGSTLVDGYWIYIDSDSLPVGQHVLNIRGSYVGYFTQADFNIEVIK